MFSYLQPPFFLSPYLLLSLPMMAYHICTDFSRWLKGFFIALSAASCIIFTFTDSFKTATGRLHHGVAIFWGIWTFNGGRKRPCFPSDYRLRWADLFLASLSGCISNICRFT
ncbi:hypothetical protein RchiOBHm_Chr6g0272721 [Rosa chinensis]|uniref:Uncharacterized protein n=1 Tax=Rosa chinensis TaxID=74649 RepID=A0A2P6PRB7_ROSCH|nr:hypothetical protein RchiOBHm_Chr6g0272721 [Rosa chinensis]